MTEDLCAVIETFKQNMLRSLDSLEERMNNNFQRLLDTTQQQFSELRQSTVTLQRKQEQAMNQTLQKLNDISIALVDEVEQDSLPIILEEQISPIINSTVTIIEDFHHGVFGRNSTAEPSIIHHIVLKKINATSAPPMRIEYDFVLPSNTTKIKSIYNVVFGNNYLDKNGVKPVLAKEFAAIEFATTKIIATRFAAAEVVKKDQRTSIILVFDPGGISFIFREIKTCIAISMDAFDFF